MRARVLAATFLLVASPVAAQDAVRHRIEVVGGYASSRQTIENASPTGRVSGWVAGAAYRAHLRGRLGAWVELTSARRGFSAEPATPFDPPFPEPVRLLESWLDLGAGLSYDLLRSTSHVVIDAGLVRSGSDGEGTVRGRDSGDRLGTYGHRAATTSWTLGLRYAPRYARGAAIDLRWMRSLSDLAPSGLVPGLTPERSSDSQQLRIAIPLWRSLRGTSP